MSQDEKISNLINGDKGKIFQKVLAGTLSTQEFFSNPSYTGIKDELMRIYKEEIALKRGKNGLFSDEAVAAAWITKLRFNEHLDNELFVDFINRAEEIFNPKDNRVPPLNLRNKTPENNSLCAIMWGIEALNGIQSFDAGATRVRLPPGIAPQIVKALEKGGAKPRNSTHATGTKLVDKGLGKDVNDESLRKYTPRGTGALLVIPTSNDGHGSIAKATSTRISNNIRALDYDLLLKRENYGYNDTKIHSRVHSKIGFINYLDGHRQKYREGILLIKKKSPFALAAEKAQGQGTLIHRKEHLSALKPQASTLITLLEEGKRINLFKDFTTKWTIRIKWPPFEKKIVSSKANSRKGLGNFLKELAKAKEYNKTFAKKNKKNLDKVEGLLEQANNEAFNDSFQFCREGNEVLVNCRDGQSLLAENIAKNSGQSEWNREKLVPSIVSKPLPEKTVAGNHFFKRPYKPEQSNAPEPLISEELKADVNETSGKRSRSL